MTQFWILTAGLIALAMAFFVLPILRRRFQTGISADELNLSVFKQQLAELDSDLEAGNLDQQRYDAAKKDLEKELLSDVPGDHTQADVVAAKGGRWMALTALAIPVAALVLYQMIGSPEIIQRLAQQPAPSNTGQAQTQNPNMDKLPPMDELVRRLAEKMEQQPDNQEGWIMLGRSYMTMKQYPEAMDAYEQAMKLDDNNVSLLLAYGEAIAAISGNSFTGKAAPLIEKAHKLEPDNPNTLWMAGIVSYQQGNFQAALTRWEKLQALLTPQSSELESVSNAIDDARKQLGMAPVEPALPQIAQTGSAPPKPTPAPAATGAKNIQVKVTLSPEMSAKASPDDLVFIYAKATSGPPMPLAAARKRVRDLPLTIALDDSMAMMPQMKLSAFPEVVVGARVSLSGSPSAQSGDLEGEVKPVVPGQSEPVNVVISSVHP
ncbi:MAG: c-type cytochrome biogenesis protein CcmI [Candidatus Thiodiazotropha sp. (ex Myrtea sp. 'scaly one' KF741663)]|nr:c-type cytochrome biogenesis protein CcmI [Candidatus Thiodiazotropha sp. (ex Myrtea sp. 'scaly one' KF741663)]